MSNIENRPKGGAPRFDAALATKSESLCRSKSCFILSLICIHLATLIVLLDQTIVEAVNYGQHDSNRSEAYTMLFDFNKNFRLPKEVVPIHYDLYLHPKLKEGTFSGKVTILIDVKQNNNRTSIALHQKDLNITSVKLITYGLDKDYEINISSISKPTKYEIFMITTENDIKSGLYNLSLEFDGSLKDKIDGFYSSTYQYASDNINETKYIGTTQFEPTYARQAFPCFDEPHLKAEFSIKLVYPMDDGYHALSNMNVKSTEIHTPERNLATVTFAKTVRMSTYLVAFIISDFVGTSKMAKGLNGREFPVNVYTTRLQSKEKRNFAVDIGVKAIEYFINLFKIDYPLPKLDMVGIPDFKANAMENWGLVTYRETRLVYDDRSNSIYDKRAVVTVICHELAHMWFGNLVTMNWWNDLWLNEGFATFMTFKCADAIEPNQKYMEEFPISIMQNVFVSDSKLSSHPIVYNVQNADDIAAIFDDISYQKGSSIVRMMENFFGTDVFFGAISSYLNKYAYKNAETTDFFEILQDAVRNKLNVTAVMDTWMRQEGFPVINVKKSENKFILTQKRFLDDQDAKFDPSESNYRYRWTIPITYITNRNKKPTLVWFDRNANKLVIKVDRRIKWIKLNAGQIGFYQVNYKKEWKTFKKLLRSRHTKISSLNRANLLGDMFSLADAGEIEYNTVMDISIYLIKENHAFPWEVAKSKLMTIHTLLTSSSKPYIADKFQSFVLMLVDIVYKNNVAWIDKTTEDVPLTHMDRILRSTVIELACAMNSPECLKRVGKLFKEWLIEEKPQHPDIHEIVYYYGMRYRSDENEWNIMFEKFKDETDPSQKNKIMMGLSGIKSTKVLKEYIIRATNETYVRTQDFLRCLTMISMNPDGTSLVWNWVRENWEFLVNRYTLNNSYLGRLIPSITRSFATQSRLDEIKAFFKKYPEAGADSNRPEAYTIMFDPDENFRLPKEVVPIHYDLYLHPKLKEGTFSGKVTILIDVKQNNNRTSIALHQKDLNITSVKLITYGLDKDYEINISSISKPTKYEIFMITTENDIKSGLYNLSLEFDGSLKDKIVGFYNSKYQFKSDKINETRYIATSKFEPTYARQAFPCFDEPNFKAEFSIKLVHPMNDCYSALSNMDVKSTQLHTPEHDLATVTFTKTVPMSTYLACFIISDFVGTSRMANGLNNRKFPITVYTTRLQSKEKRDFALNIGVKAVEYYINLFKIDYPLPKLDMAGIPDFISGAMENWGLVTYRETRMLYDNNSNSIYDKRDVINVICHELAHMWFGNLVTMKWWNDLWLNEGFATFMASKCSDAILPHQGYMEEFPVEVMQKVFVPDSKLSSHPIVYNVQNADDITSFFDGISYKKGASIIRMMENFFGSDVFFSAISTYLNKYAYENAETANLFEALQDAVGNKLNVTAIMDTWTRQEGFPVVNVKKSGNNYTLTQKRFLDDQDAKSDPSKSSYEYRWTIPIVYITNRNEVPTLVWFDKDANEVVIEVDERTKWFKLNAGQVGFYRVNYNEEWETFNELLQSHHTRISMLDRANLLDDLFSLAEAGEIEYDTVLNISMYLTEEYHCLPWAVAKSKLITIYTLLTSSTEPFIANTFQSFVSILVDTIYKDVTWTVDDAIEEDVPRIDNKVRPTVIELACAMSSSECLKRAGELFKEWLIEEKPQHPDIRELVYYYGMRYHSDASEWNIMFERFKDETDPGEKNKIMAGLAGIQSIDVLKEYIIRATDERFVRAQDFLKCLIMISKNPDGTSLVWDWVRENWEFLVNRYTLNDRYLGDLIPSITSSFATQTKLDEIKAFFEKYPEAGAGANGRAKTLETVTKNIKWLAKNTKKFDKWFSENWPFNKTR
ncbi:Glutamyl aminopeptidase [Trachymyrmex septentrionalis]|uniref:glutamyl aminopeptidase n=1 Tax=Trachymyrmex septentrionalis TaxID=34720 RepID=A0A195FSW5_9HYME|nr:Glutamyl aminopeptidase [Trachymyrmex septentrionalis]